MCMRRQTKIKIAASISVIDCGDCGEVHIRFHDIQGNVFAEASLPDDALMELTNDLMEICDEIMGDEVDDTIGETMGTA